LDGARVRERLQRLVEIPAARVALGMEGGLDLRWGSRDAVEAPVLDLEGHRLPERGDLVVGPALAELGLPPLRQVAHEVEEAGDRVAIRVVVAGGEVGGGLRRDRLPTG